MSSDALTIRIVILVLGAIALSVVLGGIYLVSTDHQIPDALIAIGSAAAASVGTILARGSTSE